MAEMPMQNPDMQQEQPMGEESQSGEGYCIQICVLPTGEIEVVKKFQMPEQPGEPVQDIRAALELALKIYNESPNENDGQAQFSAGFASQNPQQPNKTRNY